MFQGWFKSGMLDSKCYHNSPDQITWMPPFRDKHLDKRLLQAAVIHISSLEGREKQNEKFRLYSVLNFGRPGENEA